MGSSPKLKTIPTNNMRAFIILALIACASASCITRQSTTYYTPSVSQSSSSSDSSSYSTPYNSYGGYGGYSAPVYSYVEESSSDSTTYSVDPVVTEYVYEDDCVEDEPISYTITEN